MQLTDRDLVKVVWQKETPKDGGVQLDATVQLFSGATVGLTSKFGDYRGAYTVMQNDIDLIQLTAEQFIVKFQLNIPTIPIRIPCPKSSQLELF